MSDLALAIRPLGLLREDGIILSINEDALTLRDQALAASKKITAIETKEQMEDANPVLRLLANCLKHMESSRKIIKGPITQLGKKIDAEARKYSEPMEEEENRLKLMASVFIEGERHKQVEEVRTTGTTEIAATGGEGVSAVAVWDFEIMDAQKAFAANPGLFELTPKRQAIIQAGKVGFDMPHIRVFKITGVRVKA